MKNYWKKITVFTVALFLFFMPNLLWGHLYVVGGDDGRLYYIFPIQYLLHQAFHVISGNALGGNLGYFPVSYPAPLYLVFGLLRAILPHLQIQFVVYGLIFSLAFFFFYQLLLELLPSTSPYSFLGAVVASLSYILSTYVGKTFFQSQLISLFLLMVVPACLYLFLVGLRKKKFAYIIASALFYTLFSATVYSAPWFLPTIGTLIPLCVLIARKHGVYFWKALGVWVLVFTGTNMYWIVHYIIPVVYKTGAPPVATQIISASFIAQNHDLIEALANLNSPVSQIAGALRTGWGQRLGISLVESFGIVYMLCILAAGVLMQKAKKDTRILYLVSVTGLVLSMMFVTPNFGQWNVQVFEFFNDHVPLFGMFRNMYDKFALSMAFNFALSLYVSFKIFEESGVKRLVRYSALIIVGVFIVSNAWSYIRPQYNDASYSTRISGQMNSDFISLTNYIKSMSTTSRFVWLPMTFPGYVYISDNTSSNHFYTGISPIEFLTDKTDMAGFYGLQTPSNPNLNWQILDMLKNHLFTSVGYIFGSQNIGYVIVNHDHLPLPAYNVLNDYDFMRYQNDVYANEILGTKIHDFGSKYSLYTLNTKFYVPTIYLSKKLGDVPAVDKKVSFRSIADNTYDVTITGLTSPESLVFLEPYNGLWKVRIIKGNVSIPSAPTLAYNYGTAWAIRPLQSKDQTIELQIYFLPDTFITPSIIVSVVAGVISVLFCFV